MKLENKKGTQNKFQKYIMLTATINRSNVPIRKMK